ncbi:MAG: DUF2271 domain-containing protein [Pseudomonadota bacterium]
MNKQQLVREKTALHRPEVLCLVALFTILGSTATMASELTVEFSLPKIDTADYNKPYVAIWLESSGTKESLLLWHLEGRKNDKWLPDIRRWWRKLGRYGETMDAVTGATRGPGEYRETFSINAAEPFTLFLEVVREDGGRSLLKQPIDFSGAQRVVELPADREIGVTTITLGED